MTARAIAFGLLLAAVVLPAPLAAAEGAGEWGPVSFLIGKWVGEGSGTPGQGGGAFSLEPDLQKKVLVRKSFAEYPAANGRPAFRHDDLMIVFREAGKLKAIYFDNEEHVIRYSVDEVKDGVQFTSDGAASEMRFRLTYWRTGDVTAKLKFEIAPPGKPYAAYLEAGIRRE